MLGLLFVTLFTLDVCDSSLPVLPSRADGATADIRQLRGCGAASAQGLCSGPGEGQARCQAARAQWYRTHLGPETAREHSFRGSPRRGHAQHRGAWGSPRLWLPARCSRPPHSSRPRRATSQAGQEGRPSPGGGKELRSFCTHRNRADSLNHSLSRS